MPFISRALLKVALEILNRGYSPLLVVSVPCMLAQRIPTCSSMAQAAKAGIEYGSAQERQWLERYFKPGGGPPDRPWFMPGTGQWVRPRYAETSLQRRRTDFEDSAFFHPNEKRWALRKAAAKAFKEKALEGKSPISLVALMVWMWRDREIQSLRDALAAFIAEIEFDRDALIGAVYAKGIPEECESAGLSDEPPTREMIAELIGAAPPPPKVPEFSETLTALEGALRKLHVVLIPGLVGRILGGWLVGDIVVLVGPPGSGKTFLATNLGAALENLLGKERFRTTFIAINRDYDLAEFLGYENLAGEFATGKFTREVLFSGDVTDPRLVILDEWNLAQIDVYFAPILSVLETRKPIALPGRIDIQRLVEGEDIKRIHPEIEESLCALPEDTFFIATCNSWADEPETRLPVSGPVKRRCRIITMPNLLEITWRSKAASGIAEVCNTILQQEREAVKLRHEGGRNSVWDDHRAKRLDAVETFEVLEERVRQKLIQVARLLLENVHTKAFFTVGLLRDVLLSCVYGQPGEELSALGQQIADKILHQVQGESTVLEAIVELAGELPNVEELRELAKKMGAFSGVERRVRPLL